MNKSVGRSFEEEKEAEDGENRRIARFPYITLAAFYNYFLSAESLQNHGQTPKKA